MELKQGYKQTEVGIIPVEWETKKLVEFTKLFTKQTGFDYSAYIKPALVQTKTNDTIPFIQNKDFNNKWINHNTDYFIPLSVAKKFPKILLDEKSLLVSISGSIGNIGVYDSDQLAFIGGAVAILKFKDPDIIDWVMFFLKSNEGQKKLFGNVKAGSHQNLILDDIRKIVVPIPSFIEQTAIANALSDMDALISQTEKLIEKKKAIKQGTMQELLKPKEGWVTKKLGDVCEVFGRIGFRGYTVEDIVPEHQGAISLSPSNIIDGKLSLHKATYISWDKYYESPEIMVNEGDIILVKTASIGKNCVISKLDSKATVNPQIVVLKNFKMDNLLLGYIISSPIVQNQIKTKMVGGVLATLSQEEIKNFKIEVPERQEDQKRISNLLFDLDETINLIEKKLSKLKLQKQGMMQALLTGKIRLVS